MGLQYPYRTDAYSLEYLQWQDLEEEIAVAEAAFEDLIYAGWYV